MIPLALLFALAVVAPAAWGTSGFHGDGRGIDAPRAIRPGESVKIVAIGLKPGTYMVDLIRQIGARRLLCHARVAAPRKASGTVRIYGRIPTRFQCYSQLKKAFTSPVPMNPGYAKFWVHAANYDANYSLRFQSTTVAATPRFTG